jgi:hypothetical protein
MGVLFVDAKGGPSCLFRGSSDPPRLVRVGIDAAVVAQHEVCIRATNAQGRVVRSDRFRVQPTLAGLRSLSNRVAQMPGVIAVVEPTSMTWLGLSVPLADAGCSPGQLGSVRGCAAGVGPDMLRHQPRIQSRPDASLVAMTWFGMAHARLRARRCGGRVEAFEQLHRAARDVMTPYSRPCRRNRGRVDVPDSRGGLCLGHTVAALGQHLDRFGDIKADASLPWICFAVVSLVQVG